MTDAERKRLDDRVTALEHALIVQRMSPRPAPWPAVQLSVVTAVLLGVVACTPQFDWFTSIYRDSDHDTRSFVHNGFDFFEQNAHYPSATLGWWAVVLVVLSVVVGAVAWWMSSPVPAFVSAAVAAVALLLVLMLIVQLPADDTQLESGPAFTAVVLALLTAGWIAVAVRRRMDREE